MNRFKNVQYLLSLILASEVKTFRHSLFHHKHLISVGARWMWWEKSGSGSGSGRGSGGGSGREVVEGSEN